MPAFDNKENLGSLDLSEQQVMQKAQAQLQLEGGGLKELPVDHHADTLPPTPQLAKQAAGINPPAANTAAAGQQKLGLTAADSFRGDADVAEAQGPTAMLNSKSNLSFEFPDRATSAELAQAEEPVPWHRNQLPARNFEPASQHQSSNVGSDIPDVPHTAELYPKTLADHHAGACGGQNLSRLSRKQQPNRFMQCISCGAVRAS